MDSFTIHTIPGSPFARAVMVAVLEKGAAFTLAPLAPGTLQAPAHLARHPFGKMPVVDHGSFSLYETGAILRYIDRVVPDPALTPADPQRAARMDQMMSVNDWYLFQGVGNVIAFQRIVGPRLMGLTADEAVIAAAMPRAHVVFETLARQLGNQPFLVGDTLTLADIMIAPQLDFLAATPEWAPLTADRGNLRDWLDRMNARPSMAATTWPAVAALAAAA